MRRIMLAANLIQRKPDDAGLDGDEEALFDGEDGATEDQGLEFEERDSWLKNYKSPWSKVLQLWEETSEWRVKRLINSAIAIDDYMKQYPVLSETSGYLLLETDFEKNFPECSMKLFIEWPMLEAFIKSKVSSVSKKQAEEIDSALTEEGRKLRILRSLPYLFTPVTAVKKNKKQWRPSRAECADGLILHVQVSKDIQVEIDKRRIKFADFNPPMGPLAVVVGDDEDHQVSSHVVINKIIYEIDSPVKALDLAFKAYNALDAEYNKDIMREMLFLHHAINENPQRRERKQKKVLKDQKVIDAIEDYKKFKRSHQ